MPDDQSRFIDREPRNENPAVDETSADGGSSVKGESPAQAGDLPHWADWAPSKTKLWLALGPIIFIPLVHSPILWVGRPWMAANAPLLLIAVSNKAVNLALAAPQVNAILFFIIAVTRRIMFAPCYYYLGYWGSERGLEWMAENSPASARILERVTRWFPRFGPVLIMFYPAHIVRVLAGASKMRIGVFMIYEAIGAVSVAAAVWILTRQIPDQMDAILDFIKKYTWQLTVVSLVYVVIFVVWSERKNNRIRNAREEIEEIEEVLEHSIEDNDRRPRN